MAHVTHLLGVDGVVEQCHWCNDCVARYLDCYLFKKLYFQKQELKSSFNPQPGHSVSGIPEGLHLSLHFLEIEVNINYGLYL